MNILITVGVVIALIGLLIFIFASIFSRKVRRGKVSEPRWRREKERETRVGVWGYIRYIGEILAILGFLIAVVTELHVLQVGKETEKAKQEATAAKEEAQKAKEEARNAKEKADLANRNIENIERHLGIPIYTGGLASADPPVFDPFLEGTKLMTAYKWDEAISEFQKAMKEAKGSQFVGLYNLIAICYYTSGRLDFALDNYNKSLTLAEQFNDKQGKANALGNIGLIYQFKGDLDQALKYHQEALKIDKEIDFREGEASDLGNIGLIYQDKA